MRFGAGSVHLACLVLALVLMILPHIDTTFLLFVPIIGFGIAWASVMGRAAHPGRGGDPKQRYALLAIRGRRDAVDHDPARRGGGRAARRDDEAVGP